MLFSSPEAKVPSFQPTLKQQSQSHFHGNITFLVSPHFTHNHVTYCILMEKAKQGIIYQNLDTHHFWNLIALHCSKSWLWEDGNAMTGRISNHRPPFCSLLNSLNCSGGEREHDSVILTQAEQACFGVVPFCPYLLRDPLCFRRDPSQECSTLLVYLKIHCAKWELGRGVK